MKIEKKDDYEHMSRIQLIDADPKHGEVVRSQLEAHGFQVDLSLDIETARKKLHEIVPDLVVIGLNIEDTLFFEFYRWLCSAFPWSRIPRLFITGNKLTEIARELEIDSDEEIFSKPLAIARFIAKVKKLLIGRTGAIEKTDEDYLAGVPGRMIGSVSVGEEIGRGGMGAVFLGRQDSLDRQVAVKLLLPGMIGDPLAAQRFLDEARAIARVKSPHIVQIYDFGEIDHNVFYIIMGYLPGETIDEIIKKEKTLPLEKAFAVVSQVAAGLQVAHSAGLIHRDIKPSNLIFSSSSHVTITDFGLVQPQQEKEQSQGAVVMGSPHYMSPEQAAGKSMDPRSDIYSLGVVFYHMLVGKVPFDGDNPIKIMLQQINDPFPGLDEMSILFPPSLVKVIQRMTEKNPADRYRDCNELIAGLKACSSSFNNHSVTTVTVPFVGAPENQEHQENEDLPANMGGEETVVVPFPSHGLETIPVPAQVVETGANEAPPAETTNKKLSPVFEHKLVELNALLPSVIEPHRLSGWGILTPAGQFLESQGDCPLELQANLSLLQDTIHQVDVAVGKGQWRFLVLRTRLGIGVLFPKEKDLGILFLAHDRNDSPGFHNQVGKPAEDTRKFLEKGQEPGDSDLDALEQMASIAGVQGVVLFDMHGRLLEHRQFDGTSSFSTCTRFSPVVPVIHSIGLDITDMDLWFENGRVLLWKIDRSILFIIASPSLGYSFLSIFIDANRERLAPSLPPTSIEQEKGKEQEEPEALAVREPTPTPPPLKKETVNEPPVFKDIHAPQLLGIAPRTLLNQLQIEISREIGPIGKVILEREIKSSGYSKENFPFTRIPLLARKLAEKIGTGEREKFLEKIHRLISRHHPAKK